MASVHRRQNSENQPRPGEIASRAFYRQVEEHENFLRRQYDLGTMENITDWIEQEILQCSPDPKPETFSFSKALRNVMYGYIAAKNLDAVRKLWAAIDGKDFHLKHGACRVKVARYISNLCYVLSDVIIRAGGFLGKETPMRFFLRRTLVNELEGQAYINNDGWRAMLRENCTEALLFVGTEAPQGLFRALEGHVTPPRWRKRPAPSPTEKTRGTIRWELCSEHAVREHRRSCDECPPEQSGEDAAHEQDNPSCELSGSDQALNLVLVHSRAAGTSDGAGPSQPVRLTGRRSCDECPPEHGGEDAAHEQDNSSSQSSGSDRPLNLVLVHSRAAGTSDGAGPSQPVRLSGRVEIDLDDSNELNPSEQELDSSSTD